MTDEKGIRSLTHHPREPTGVRETVPAVVLDVISRRSGGVSFFLQRTFEFEHEHVVLDHVFGVPPYRNNIVIERNRG